MAVCPNCGAENSNESRWCGKCGKELSGTGICYEGIQRTSQTGDQVSPNRGVLIEDAQDWQGKASGTADVKQNEMTQQKKKEHRIIILVVVFAILGIIAVLAFLSNPALLFSKEEKMAFSAAKEIQQTLLRPESMRLENLAIRTLDDGDIHIVVDYNAENKGGGITEASALVGYEDGECEILQQTDGKYGSSENNFAEAVIGFARLEATSLDSDAVEKIEKAIQ